MGVQQFSQKKVKRIAAICGIELDMVWNLPGTTAWYEARTPLDRHLMVNVRTGEVDFDVPYPNRHMTSCRRV